MVGLRDPVLDITQRTIKRIFDLTISFFGLVLAAPLMTLISVVIKLDSPGPALFKQTRVGEGGKSFQMFKFRTMVQDADRLLPTLMEHDDEGNLIFKHKDDPRITRVGHFLRRSSLDELPQLFNVLKGEMSLVGPRPELPFVVETYEPWQRKRFAVPPGITGWWQVSGRSDKPMHLFTEDDLYYISHYSLLLDLQILWTTVGAVLKGKGAY
jgi:exopolysaccharide biosynthesis polyprenyl glycosylphosphotransferase